MLTTVSSPVSLRVWAIGVAPYQLRAGGWSLSARDVFPAQHRAPLPLDAEATRLRHARGEIYSAARIAALPGWRSLPAPRRGEILFRAAALLRQRKDEVARALTQEEGKSLGDAGGEVQRAINCLEFSAGEGRRSFGQTIPSELPSNLIYTRRIPLGVVALVTPWNVPLAIPLGSSRRRP